MAFDAHKNFAYSTVATAPSPPSSGTSLVVEAGHGSRFPAPSFNVVVWPAGAIPTPANSEVVRVTAISTDLFTITRTQEGSSARTIVAGDQIAAAITNKALTDIESAAEIKVAAHVNLLIPTLWGTITEPLTFTGAMTLAATLTAALLTINQSGSGDIVSFQDSGVERVRFPDGGGIVLVAQAGGFQSIVGLLGYDNAAAGFRRLKLYHEGHNYPVPVDPRNGFANIQIQSTYPAVLDQSGLDNALADQFQNSQIVTSYP